MARRKANDGFAVVILLLAAALAYIAPFIIIGFWAYYEYQARLGIDPRTEAGFERQDERRQLREERELAAARIAELHQQGADHGLNRRQDRMFDARFAEGRELNALIEAESEAHTYAHQQLAAIVEPLARRDALRGALIGYFGTLLFLWSRSSELTAFWMSACASGVAVVAAGITYAVRKAHYSEN